MESYHICLYGLVLLNSDTEAWSYSKVYLVRNTQAKMCSTVVRAAARAVRCLSER